MKLFLKSLFLFLFNFYYYFLSPVQAEDFFLQEREIANHNGYVPNQSNSSTQVDVGGTRRETSLRSSHSLLPTIPNVAGSESILNRPLDSEHGI